MAGRKGVGKRRREQIIEAAVAIIAEQGLQHLSLSAIEEKAGMSRGQLTYYFPAKEEILLAVFERMIETMHLRILAVLQQRRGEGEENSDGCPFPLEGWQRISAFLAIMLLHPPELAEFHSLKYTFLSQIGHREDFRARLASLFGEWRNHMAADFARDLPESRGVSPRTLAAFVQALLHGLAIQRGVDADAYDRQEMLTLCSELLGSYLEKPAQAESPSQTTPRG